MRRGFTLPPQIGIGTVVDGLRHPGWTWRFVTSEPITFSNVTGHNVGDGTDAVSLAAYVGNQFDPGMSWRDIEWLRTNWKGPIVLKGIQTIDDAEIAVSEGIEAIVLSNHGGRQLDFAPAPVELLPSVVDSVGGEVEIIVDGGVRRGSDIVKALALGAQACMAGRAYLYGLGVGGERGVDHVLDLLGQGMRATMALIGCRSVRDINSDLVRWRGDVAP
ncbi:MAG: alpha-hydroxy acid oxidase [Acidimicrobiia bacterium]